MNAERLHAIVKALKSEMDNGGLVRKLESLVEALRNVIQPSASNQQALSQNLSSMYSVLTDAPSDRFSPSWRQVLRETGGEEFFGAPLKRKIEETIANNQMTPSVAADVLDEIRKRMDAFRTALQQATSSLSVLRIGDEQLEPGDCEIGILIPRGAVDNHLNSLADEFKDLSFILNTFSEVATGHSDELEIRTISSSDFLLYLNAQVTFAACLALGIERVVALYKSLLEIRKLQVEIRAQGVPDAATKGIAEHANKHMQHGIDKVSVEIISQFYKGKDGGRKNELITAVKFSLNKIANRIDAGYNLEVRCEPIADDEAATAEVKQAVTTIRNASANMQFLKLEGEPLLKLPEHQDEKAKKKKTMPEDAGPTPTSAA